MEPLLVTGNATLDHWLAILGIVMSVSSTAASVLNGKIRAALDEGDEIPALFLYAGLVINTVALNVDKASQMNRLIKGGSVSVTKVAAKKKATGEEVRP